MNIFKHDNKPDKVPVFWEHALREHITRALDSFFIINGSGRFIEVNQSCCDLLGYARDELLSASLGDIDTLKLPIYDRHGNGGSGGRGNDRFLTSYRRKDGRLIDVEATITEFTADGERYFFIQVHNLEGRKERIWGELTKNSLLELFLKNTSRGEYLVSVAELLQSWSGCRHVGIRLVKKMGIMYPEPILGVFDGMFMSVNGLGPAGGRNGYVIPGIVTGGVEDKLQVTSEGSVFCNDVPGYVESLPPGKRDSFMDGLLAGKLNAVALIPCVYQENLVGAIHLADERDNMVPLRVVNFIQSIAPLVGEAIYRFNVEEKLRRNHETQIAINSILRVAQEPIPLEQIFEHTLETMAGMPWLADSPGSAIFLYDEKKQILTLKAHRGFAREWTDRCSIVPSGTCACGQTSRDRRMKLVFSDGKDSAEDCGGTEPHYHYSAPIVFDDKVLGVMLVNLNGEYVSSDEDELYLNAIAGALAGIIDRKEKEQALDLENKKTGSILQAMNDGVIIVNREADIKFVNAIMERDFGTVDGRKYHEYLRCAPGDCSWCGGGGETSPSARRKLRSPVNDKTYDVYSTVITNADQTEAMVEFYHDITRLVEYDRQIAYQAELLAQVNDAIIACDNDHRITYWNRAAETIYGWTAEEAVGRGIMELLKPSGECGNPGIDPFGNGAPEKFRCEMIHHSRDGSLINIETTGIRLNGASGVPEGFVSVNRDITQRKISEASMHKLSMAVEHGSDWVLITDRNGTIEYSNRIVEQITGYGRDEIIGNTPRLMSSGRHDPEFYKNLWDTILAGNTFRSLFINRRKNGELFYIDMSITPLSDEKGLITHFIASGKDVTQQKHMEEQLISLVHFDMLTGLPNRTLFKDRLAQALVRGEYSKRMVAVLNLDIDRFKFLNDSYGVATGDEIIKNIASRLAGAIREGDILARMGSDEFGLILVDVAQKEDFIVIVEKLLRVVSEPMYLQDNEFVVTVSIGISIYPSDGDSADRVLQNAEIAVSKAKNLGRNSYQFYTTDMNVRASEFMIIEKHLFGALGNNEFIIYYQPYYDIKTREMVGIEALLRWNNPALGMIEPDRFIPILEETGMMSQVGSLIVQSVCEQIVAWQEKGFRVPPIAINISPVQFRHPDLAESLEKIVANCHVDPAQIIFELTESILMQDQKYASEVLGRLRSSGFSISIDDFGTGYSSLSYIKRFPFNYLKIDKSFIDDMMSDSDSGSIVTTVITLAHNLNLKTIAEGVETQEQYNILRILKCDYVQGFFLSRPMPASSIEEVFARNEMMNSRAVPERD